MIRAALRRVSVLDRASADLPVIAVLAWLVAPMVDLAERLEFLCAGPILRPVSSSASRTPATSPGDRPARRS